jgi:hypothetical protein
MSGWEVFQIWLGAFLTLAMFSFLYKDNPVYKAAEHIFAGITAGYYVALYLDTVVYQQMFVPLTADFGANWRLFIPGALGLLIFARLWPKLSWLSRFGLAFMMGSTAGIFLASELHGKVLGQISGTMQIQQVAGSVSYLLTAIVFVGLLTTLIYFYFSKPHTGLLGVTASVGIWFIMISFGAHFGYTVMGRVSLLIGRVYFLYNDWIGTMR